MLTELNKASRLLEDGLASADPDLVTTSQAADIIERAAEVKRKAEAVELLYAQRAADSRRWAEEGHPNAASWLAATTKGSIGDAFAAFETSRSLDTLPKTTEALRHGELSFDQAREIASAAASRPGAEAELLSVADRKNLKALKDACNRERARVASAAAEAERHRAVHRARHVRHWSDPDGAFCLALRTTSDAGAEVLASIRAEADLVFEDARTRGDHEPQAAYLADALVACVTGRARSQGHAAGASARPSVHIRVDAAALRRGHVGPGETCEIPGVGPVPVAHARRQLSDASLKCFAVHGTDVLSVCHVGRTVPAHLQSALEERDPVCVVPACGVAQGLENHHWDVPYADCKTTSLEGIARACRFHHDLITYQGYTLEGGPGKWVLRPPPDADPFDTS